MTSSNEILIVDSLRPAMVGSQDLVAPQAKALPSAIVISENLFEWERLYVAANAPATVKALKADWGVFDAWCMRENVCGLPIASDTFVRFLNDMMIVGKKRSTLNRYINTIRVVHRGAGLNDPTDFPLWSLQWGAIVKRLSETNQNAPVQAEPLRSKHVDQIVANLGTALIDLRDAALISVASDTLCRESELAKLLIEDVKLTDAGDWTIDLRRSKTDQGALGEVRYLSPESKAAIDEWCAAAELERGYLFVPVGRRRKVSVNGRGEKSLGAAEVARVIRRRAIAAGIQGGSLMSGHSARVGSTIDLVENGANLVDIQYAGGWHSPRMVQQYGKQAMAGRSAMAELRKGRRAAGPSRAKG